MPPLAFVARPRRTSYFRLSFMVLALTLGYSSAANANTVWLPGDVLTNGQGDWAASTLLGPADFFTVYATTGSVSVGLPSPGFSMSFAGGDFVQAYLPASGAPGPLDANLDNPASSSSGVFGGDVLALELNVDFSNAGFLLGTSGIPFGNLILTGFGGTSIAGLDGLTVSQFLAIDNTLLGGGSVTGFSIADLDPVTFDVNSSFLGGTPSTFAQNNLMAPATVTPTPEPGTLILLGTGLLGVAGAARRKWLR